MKRHKVYFSPLAQLKLELILQFLVEEWSTQSKTKFLKKFQEKVDQISTHPLSCIESEQLSGIRKAVVEKHTSIYYRIHKDEIEVITIFDNRQNPSLIQKEISRFRR